MSSSSLPWDRQAVASFIETTGVCHATVWHVGTFDAAKKGWGSHDGNGLSVSLHPAAWCRMTPLEGDLYRLDKASAVFADGHACLAQPQLMEHILAWAEREGYVAPVHICRVSSYDSEEEAWVHTDFLDRQRALTEYRSLQMEAEGDVTARARFRRFPGRVPTERMAREMWHRELPLAFVQDFTLLCFAAHCLPHLDGVWWDDVFAPAAYSAPHGAILPHRVDSWSRTLAEWRL